MNKTKIKPSTGEGWAVHVYDSDRRLRFTLESSHIWVFGWGIGVGLMLAIIGSALHSASHNLSNSDRDLINFSPTIETKSQEDLDSEPTKTFPFWID